MYDSMSHCAPGYRFQYQVPPKSPAFSITRMRSMPASRSLAAVIRPPRPPPMITTSTSSRSGSRTKPGAMYGSSTYREKSPLTSWYCSLPSSLIRLSRSTRYFSRSSSGSKPRPSEAVPTLETSALLGVALIGLLLLRSAGTAEIQLVSGVGRNERPARSGGERHRQRTHAPVVARSQLGLRPLGDAEVRDAGQELLEHDPGLEPGQVHTDATVDALTERDVAVRAAVEVDHVGVRELVVVAVGRPEQQDQSISLLQRRIP